jgi:hypothetical protein
MAHDTTKPYKTGLCNNTERKRIPKRSQTAAFKCCIVYNLTSKKNKQFNEYVTVKHFFFVILLHIFELDFIK